MDGIGNLKDPIGIPLNSIEKTLGSQGGWLYNKEGHCLLLMADMSSWGVPFGS